MTTRPRGFIDYRPRADALALIQRVSEILHLYRDHLPLTLRQIFYRLVVADLIQKTEKAYKNQLCETMNKARRAHLVPMDAIRDDGFSQSSVLGYTTINEFLETLGWRIKNFILNHQNNQPRKLFLWCEAQGMVPQLRRVADNYSVQVLSSGGFDSLTSKHAMAEELSRENKPVEVLHLGDYDPSGVHMFSSLDEDVQAFARHYGSEITFTRLVVTPEQINHYGLPTAPPKETDRRSFESDYTTQAEALPPDELAKIVKTAIESRMDMKTYRKVLTSEKAARKELEQKARLGGLWVDS